MSDDGLNRRVSGGQAPKVPPPPVVPPATVVPGLSRVPPASVVPGLSRVPPPPKVPQLRPGLFKRAQPAPPARQSILTPEELERFRNLLVFARSTVEGYFVGKHKSPHRGSSVEFADYKEYVPGDEVSRIDWRAYARSKRLFVRQYEAETDMVVYLLVDVSASMRYAGAGRQSKYMTAAKIAAALAYLMLRQGDKASLVLFSDTVKRFLAPGGTRRHLHNLVTELEQIAPASTTGIVESLHHCDALFRKRGRIIILSDFWTDTSAFFDALARLVHRKFDILLLHVLDPDELALPPADVARFQDMETGEEVQVELSEIRSAYQDTMEQRIKQVALEANNCRVKHAVVNTRSPYLEAIEAYLGFRGSTVYATG
jgi:uncharacterized protein (DUF58 family)